MNCPFCFEKETKVLDSRLIKQGSSVRRRRKCLSCEKRFTTYEQIELEMPRICKSDGRREDYHRDKIRSGIEKSCQKLPISNQQIQRILDTIERELQDKNSSEIKSREIGEIVMKHLKHLNATAYVRFASVYKTFKDIDQFFEDLKMDDQAWQQKES